MKDPAPLRSLSVHLYRWVVRLYPPTFRQQYGTEMIHCFHDMLRERAHAGLRGTFWLWVELFLDTATSVPRAHLEEWSMMQTSYTRSSHLGAIAAIVTALVWLFMFTSDDIVQTFGGLGALGFLSILCSCLFATLIALHKRLAPLTASAFLPLGLMLGVVSAMVGVGGMLLWSFAGVGVNGIAFLAIIFALWGLLLGLACLGLATLSLHTLGIWRFFPVLALPMVVFLVATSGISAAQAGPYYLYHLQGGLFACVLFGTGGLLWRNAR
jgi:hypothetical protein